MKKSCGILIGVFFVLWGVYFALLYPKSPLFGAVVLGFFGALSVVVLFGGLSQAFQTRSKTAAIRRALAAEPPQDGQFTAGIGRIQPLGMPLKSPVFGRNCIAYSYDVYMEGPPLRGETKPTRDILYTGMAMAPCAVESPQGKIRLMGFPMLEHFSENFAKGYGEAPYFLEYQKKTAFEAAVGRQKLSVISDLENLMMDDDGVVRQDWRMMEVPEELLNFKLGEKIVPPGEDVVVFGRYSAERQGLVNQMGIGGAVNDLYPGGHEKVLKEIQDNSKFLILFALAWSGIANGIILAILLK